MFRVLFKNTVWKSCVGPANRITTRTVHQDAIKFVVTNDEVQESTSDHVRKSALPVEAKELSNFSPPRPFEEILTEKVDSEVGELLDALGPPLPVSFNLAAYVNRSETLIKLVQLGVDLSAIEKNPAKAKFVLKLEFDKHVKEHIKFLNDHGVESDALGTFITKNPYIFKEDLENLEIRINYLKSKKFSGDAISWILMRNPLILSLNTKQIDSRLGFLQKQFYLKGSEVRHVFTRCPKLFTYEHKKILEKLFIFKELFGFTSEEMKKLLIMKPKIWMLGVVGLKDRFNVVHNIMNIPQERIVECPNVLLKRSFLLKQRHQYLIHLGQAQYDPKQPKYISLLDLSSTTDAVFCQKCANTSVDKYNEFLKTL